MSHTGDEERGYRGDTPHTPDLCGYGNPYFIASTTMSQPRFLS